MALCAIWSYPSLEGCYLDRDIEPENQIRFPMAPRLLRQGHLGGIAHLPNGKHTACGTCVVRESLGGKWVMFYLPLGALSEVYPVGSYPFGDEQAADEWQPIIDGWLVKLGQHIFATQPFHMALIGHEVSGTAPLEIPAQRYIGYLCPALQGLEYFPRNTR